MALSQELKDLILSALGWKERADELISAIQNPQDQMPFTPAPNADAEMTGSLTINGYHLEPSNPDAGATVANALTIDLSTATVQTVTLTDDVTISLANPAPSGAAYLIKIKTGEGGFAVSWDADVLWPDGTAPTVSTDPNMATLVNLLWDGESYLGSFAQSYDLPAVAATLDQTHDIWTLAWTAVTAGTAGNSITITMADDADPGDETVEVVGSDITFHMADGDTTFDVLLTLASDVDVVALVSVDYNGGAGVVVPTEFYEGPLSLSGGLD